MCGIAGFSNFQSASLNPSTLIEKMLSLLIHRGPDDQGTLSNTHFTFGHRRLAIIDPDKAQQPCHDTDGNILIFNGEIYGYQLLAKQLHQQNIKLRNDSDTEVLFNLLKYKGIEKALNMIDGMFAFAYYHQQSQQLYLARDRFGEKPLFYTHQHQQIIFASEIKALRQHPLLQKSSLDPRQISTFLTLEYLPDTMTGYSSINKLLPGHWLSFDYKTGHIHSQKYHQVVLQNSTHHLSESERIDQLEKHLSQSVKQRLIADVPVGVFLSGGLDSSLIAALAKQHTDSIHSYTIKMPDSSFDESPYAEHCAKALGLQHTSIHLDNQDIFNTFETITEKLDEPLADSSLIPSTLLCQFSSQHIKVAIGGDGADELFAGYPNFKAQKLAPLMQHIPASFGQVFRQVLAKLPSSNQYMNLAFQLQQLSYGFGLPIEQQSINWMSALHAEEQKKLWRCSYHKNINHELNKLLKQLSLDANNEDKINQLLYIFTHTYLPNNILTKMDRASMYSSLEVRSPFLDKTLTNFIFSLPTSDKIKGLSGKVLLKKLALKHLPKEIITRKKHGFGFPISHAIRHQLKTPIADTLFDHKNPLLDWFNLPSIETYWQEHQSYKQDHGKKLWAIYIAMKVAST